MRRVILSVITCLLLLVNSNQALADGGGPDSETFETITKLIAPLYEAANLPRKKRNLYILIDEEINAFVWQGDLFINTGLITAFNDPDVLKGVVAHELGHMSSGHAIIRGSQINSLMNQSWITTLLGISAAAIARSPEMGAALVLGSQHAAERRYMAYSREQETVADRLAVKYLHETGNTIAGLTKLLERFNSDEMYLGDRGISPYMLTHPLSRERLKLVREYSMLEKNNPAIQPSNQSEKERYARVVAKLRAFLDTDNYLSTANKDLSGFSKTYGDAIAFYRKSQFEKSFSLLDSLIAEHPKDGYLYELKGQFLFETGKMLPAVESYREAVSILGDRSSLKSDYALVLINSVSLYKERSKREAVLNEAIDILNKVLAQPYRRSPYIYRNLAIAYGTLGKIGYSNLMLAEEAILLGQNAEAKKFIAIAQNYSGKDTKLHLKIEDINKSLDRNA
jgi:predicted Zn-dependent protease